MDNKKVFLAFQLIFHKFSIQVQKSISILKKCLLFFIILELDSHFLLVIILLFIKTILALVKASKISILSSQ